MIQLRQFWEFMTERERIRLRRLNGKPRSQWTTDPIFKEYKFTNVKRCHDRTTMQMYGELYKHHHEPHPSPVTLLNAMLYRYFGTISMARAIGWLEDWNDETHADIVRMSTGKMLMGERVFTSAYIVPNCGSDSPKNVVVATIVDTIWKHAVSILDTDSWKAACSRMCVHWGVGEFMSKEVLLDYILSTGWEPRDWSTWTPVGPGARRGAGAVRDGTVYTLPVREALEMIREIHGMREDWWPKDLVELDLTDIQFQLCEYAKYAKVKQGIGRPKCKFNPTIDAITVRMP